MFGIIAHICPGAQRINWDLMFRVVNKHILKEPRKVNQAQWVGRSDDYPFDSREDMPPCGTVCCFAGWTVVEGRNLRAHNGMLSGRGFRYSKNNDGEIEEEARKLLGLTEDEGTSHCRIPGRTGLFSPLGHGEPPSRTPEHARAVADRMYDFAHSHGVWPR